MTRTSWIITETLTGKPVFETWNQSVASKVNTDRYTVETALAYLYRINAEIKASQ